MDRFISDLARYSHQLKDRSLAAAFGGVTLCYASDAADDDAVLRCNRQLLVHWKNFVKALRSFDEHSNRSINQTYSSEIQHERKKGEGWWLSKVELTHDMIHLLEPILLGRSNLRTLILDRNEFGSSHDGAVFLRNLTERNPYLKRLSFHNNPIEDFDDMARFCEVVRGHPSLQHLTLENIGLGDDEEKLSMILNASKNLECLGLSNNGIGSPGSADLITQFLAEADENNTKIVYLRDNDFGDDTADLFASALRNNTNLRVVDISGNQFTQSGRKIIRNALFDTSSLKAAIESNHTTVVYIDESSVLKEKLGAINSRGNPVQNLHRKVFATLYAATDGGRLNHLLTDIPLELMPEVLDYLQDYYLNDIPRGMRKHAMEMLQDYMFDDFEEVYARQDIFSIVFEVLRSWNLPLLYTNL